MSHGFLHLIVYLFLLIRANRGSPFIFDCHRHSLHSHQVYLAFCYILLDPLFPGSIITSDPLLRQIRSYVRSFHTLDPLSHPNDLSVNSYFRLFFCDFHYIKQSLFYSTDFKDSAILIFSSFTESTRSTISANKKVSAMPIR